MGTLASRLRQGVLFCGLLAIWTLSLLLWQRLGQLPLVITLVLVVFCLLLVCLLVLLRVSLTKSLWVKLWLFAVPWLLCSIFGLPAVALSPVFPVLIVVWVMLGMWGAVRFYPFHLDHRLH